MQCEGIATHQESEERLAFNGTGVCLTREWRTFIVAISSSYSIRRLSTRVRRQENGETHLSKDCY